MEGKTWKQSVTELKEKFLLTFMVSRAILRTCYANVNTNLFNIDNNHYCFLYNVAVGMCVLASCSVGELLLSPDNPASAVCQCG